MSWKSKGIEDIGKKILTIDKDEIENNFIEIDLEGNAFYINSFIDYLMIYSLLIEVKTFKITNANFIIINEDMTVFSEDLNFEQKENDFQMEFLSNLEKFYILFEKCDFFIVDHPYIENFNLDFKNYFFSNQNFFYFINFKNSIGEEDVKQIKKYKQDMNKLEITDTTNNRKMSNMFLSLLHELNQKNLITFYSPITVNMLFNFFMLNSIFDKDEFLDNTSIHFTSIEDKKLLNSEQKNKYFNFKLSNQKLFFELIEDITMTEDIEIDDELEIVEYCLTEEFIN